MEERIIDDEYGRGVRLRKTEDGYVDVTDELAEEGEEGADEVAFEFPTFDGEDDEDLVGLSPEEALALRQKKQEERAQRRAEYERLCAEGEELLATDSYNAAELKYEKALALDDLAVEASVGYWRAKTENFHNADVLVGEYVDEGIESMEYDLGIQATDCIRRDFHEIFVEKVAALEAEEKPLEQEVAEKQARRREVIRGRVKKGTILFVSAVIPFVIALITTAILGMKITSTTDNTFVLPTIIAGVVSFGLFILTLICFNTFLNAMRMRGKNERLSSTEEGEKLLQIRQYKAIYEYLAINPMEEGREV